MDNKRKSKKKNEGAQIWLLKREKRRLVLRWQAEISGPGPALASFGNPIRRN